MVSSVQLTGRAAAASGVLMIAGVEGEWLFNPQRDDGTVTNMPVFALLMLTALLKGSPLEASFIAFLLGMLLLSVGPVTWGLSLWRRSPAPGVWQMLLLSGAAAFAALAIEPDPWHDISLMVMFAAWSTLGVLLLRQPNQLASERRPSHTAHRMQDRS